MTLRQRVVGAGARAIRAERDREKSAVEFHGRDELQAEAALDAMLDCLTENADEWIDVTGVLEWHDWSERAIVAGLVDVLREDR